MLRLLHSYSSCVCIRYLFRKHKFCLIWNLLRGIIFNLRRCNQFQKMQMNKFHIRHTHADADHFNDGNLIEFTVQTLHLLFHIWFDQIYRTSIIWTPYTATKCDLFAQLTFSVNRFDSTYSPKQKNSGLN